MNPSLAPALRRLPGQDLGGTIHRHCQDRPAADAIRFFRGGDLHSPHVTTYRQLDRRARGIAEAAARHAGPGDRVLLVLPEGPQFVEAFLSCLYGGTVAVPAPLPAGQPHHLARFAGIVRDAQVSLVLTTSLTDGMVRAAMAAGTLPSVPTMVVGEGPDGPLDGAADWRPVRRAADDAAFLQYTSGSTSAPKGVVVTHGSLAHNEELIARAFGTAPGTPSGGWLPLFHDMGLIGQVLGVLSTGGTAHLMAPTDFLKSPARWLQLISEHRLQISGGPNFGYDLCLRRVPDSVLETLDLSSWRVAYNGAEPVRPATLDAFAERFAPAGFDRGAFFPCYGLAEGTLFVSGGHVGRTARPLDVDRQALGHGAVVPCAPGEGSRQLVTCGTPPAPDVEVTVVGADGTRLPEGQVGEIWVRGPSVCPGYWDGAGGADPRDTFGHRLDGEPGYLRTGDLGSLVGGELVITGRSKEMLLIRGRNLYPHDIEAEVRSAHPAIDGRIGAVFGVGEEDERLVVVQEVRPPQLADCGAPAVVRAIRSALVAGLQLSADAVVLVPPGTVLRTTSGKIQRAAMRRAFLDGRLEALHEEVHPELSPRGRAG